MDGELEAKIKEEASQISPIRMVMIRRTQLIQSGVTINDGPTLEQIKAEEEAQNASIDEEIGESEITEDAVDEGEANPDGEETVESSADLGETLTTKV